MSLRPEVKVGQIWQCADQRYLVRITEVSVDKFTLVHLTPETEYTDLSGTRIFNTRDLHQAFSDLSVRGSWHLAVKTLVYDPST